MVKLLSRWWRFSGGFSGALGLTGADAAWGRGSGRDGLGRWAGERCVWSLAARVGLFHCLRSCKFVCVVLRIEMEITVHSFVFLYLSLTMRCGISAGLLDAASCGCCYKKAETRNSTEAATRLARPPTPRPIGKSREISSEVASGSQLVLAD